jgi:hypothetical protein
LQWLLPRYFILKLHDNGSISDSSVYPRQTQRQHKTHFLPFSF